MLMMHPNEASDMTEIIRLLDLWAAYNRGWHGPSGAPRMAIEYSAVFGPQGAEPDWPDDVCRIESALTVLGLESKTSLDIIRWLYVQTRTKYEICKKLRCSRDELDARLNGIMHRICEILGGNV